MSLIYDDGTLPDPIPDEAALGWKISVTYLTRIANLVEQDWDRPSLETVQYVLLAHAAQQFKLLG